MKKVMRAENIKDFFLLLLGGSLYAFALVVFLMPKGIIVGGVSGVATTLNILFELPVGMMILLINLPLVIANAFVSGARFMYRTLIGVVLTSVLTDIFAPLAPSESEALVCALLGGACLGAGVGVMFYLGVTTGGTDLAACLVKRRFKHISTGRLILVIDAMIIFVCAIALGNFDGILYSLVASITTAFSLDAAESGLVRSKMLIVITDRSEIVCSALSQRVRRGITLIDCKGWYSKEKKQMILCVVKRSELYYAKQEITQKDPEAFVVVSDIGDVFGRGFEGRGI